ncbi:MAG: hypothetical protein Q4E74_05700 [Ruminococcus sp.]|nr:hypothetical protein [Ruminococcus sp.]
MGLFDDPVFKELREKRRESSKWTAFFALFALVCMAAMAVTSYSKKHSDLLGGRKTVEQYLHSNVTAMVIILAIFIAFVVAVFKTWKGVKGSIYQFMMTIFTAFIIAFTGIGKFLAIHNITDDLNNVRDITAEEYVLCRTDGSNFYLGFEDKGECILLLIPEKKYNELKQGTVSDVHTENEVYRLVVDSTYGGYKDAELYCTPVSVKYYFNSVIYEDCEI